MRLSRRELTLFSMGLMAFQTGCGKQSESVPIAVNAWIGYAPIVYAAKKQWLAPTLIQVYETVSLGKSLSLYDVGVVDAFSATQHEYYLAYQRTPDLVPVMLLDRSNGGDGVVANRTLVELRQTSGSIEVYLEANSINKEVFQQFIMYTGLAGKTFNLHHQDQLRNTFLSPTQETPVLVVTYSPYMEQLEEKGFHRLADTRTMPLLVVDMLVMRQHTFLQHQALWQNAKQAIDRAIEVFEMSPQDAFAAVRDFLDIASFELFQEALKGIEWVNHPSKALLRQLKAMHIPTTYILK